MPGPTSADWDGMVDALFGRMGRLLAGDTTGNGRSLAYVWCFGASCLTATLLLPHPAAANDLGLAVIAVLGYLGAAILVLRAGTLPLLALETFTYLGQLLITGLALFWGPDAPFLWFHVWLVVHSFHFLPPARASRQIVVAAALFVFATVATHTSFPAATSLVGVGTVAAVGMLVGAFRARVDELLRASAHSASMDPLTGLANRRAFGDSYAAERARSARQGTLGAMLVLDCDGFKALNDRHGHVAGDLALRRLAEVIHAHVREVDTAARLGGDEFAVLLSAPDPGAAAVIGARIQRAFAGVADPPPPTLSIGIVELPADVTVDLNTALAAADRAMYRSKTEGGNRVCVGALPDVRVERPAAACAPVTTVG
jgi:diguanylate cyclase (GGDEF)-like protein